MQAKNFLNYCLNYIAAENYLLYVNQTNLNGKLQKKLEGVKQGTKQKPARAMAYAGPP